jgi:hypothetical protein
MEVIAMNLTNCTPEGVSTTFGPYLRDCLLRDGRFRNQLGIYIELYPGYAFINAVATRYTESPTLSPMGGSPSLAFTFTLSDDLTPEALNKLFTDFVAHIPGEHVVSFKAYGHSNSMKEALAVMPNIQRLHLVGVSLTNGFLQPDPCGPHANTKILPSLRYLHLEDMEEDSWSPLIPYLAHQTSGGQAVSLRITGESVDICPSVVGKIKDLVEELVLESTLRS